MAGVVLADTGRTVAILRRRDRHHHWARSQFAALTDTLVTCEAVFAESFF
jgi:hypothetical protein